MKAIILNTLMVRQILGYQALKYLSIALVVKEENIGQQCNQGVGILAERTLIY